MFLIGLLTHVADAVFREVDPTAQSVSGSTSQKRRG
jgi:hypothetical protein